MKICAGAVGLLAATWVLAGSRLAAAATSTTSFGVSARVTATCMIAAAPWIRGPVCLRPAGPVIAPATPPVVSFSRDPQTGVLVQTISF